MVDSINKPSVTSAWPHRLAVALVCATFPMIWVGGLVTTYGAGMAVPDWPTTYGYNLLLYPWQTWLLGPWDLFIEHGHRLLGTVVGLLTIALVVMVWLRDRRAWLRALAVGALVAVIAQGVLGGMRVLLDATTLAKIHGCFGPAFFALTVALAAVTSHTWQARAPRVSQAASQLQRLALITTALAYLQIVLGAQLRHVGAGIDPGWFRTAVVFHLVVAALVTIHVALVAARVWRSYRAESALLRPASALVLLIFVQLALGGATWVSKYGWPTWLGEHAWTASFVVSAESSRQAMITTGHVAVGALILAIALLLTLRAFRFLRSDADYGSARLRFSQLRAAEGAAIS